MNPYQEHDAEVEKAPVVIEATAGTEEGVGHVVTTVRHPTLT